ncbi:UDP-N-acetylmuramoyl-L-alanyl-D-glutamate--2,6-diaminopimelate ligase [Vibrio sp. T187]|uniref:Mur ligase family protein n=1 Tax=Vibrio TaxID=662 RepID=UPI0010C93A60|nr:MULTISPECIES: UDP-N-acetylmuramoyl-L-alanyl-D-glutamate--2,6-diaminopimelate ligase [Vibrio]MBW3698442.1 UDP-N-acetylmuramoyl-L-alanyl-D-glutamate--2,6-diaminopimelate ligase [Vibrio sp. T187]
MLSEKLKGYVKRLSQLSVRQFLTNSESIRPNDVFVCREGAAHDSHGYIESAVANGAIAIIATKPVQASVPVFVTESYYQSLSLIKAVYQYPHHHIRHLGVTGTNGKTTVAHGLNQILNQSVSSAYIGTLGVEFGDKKWELANTTPDGVTLLNLFNEMVESEVQCSVMELSSHALVQDRAGFVPLEVGIVTNIGRDHLDYHRTLDGYVQAKLQIIDRIKPNGFAVINLDDAHAHVAMERAKYRVQTLTFSINNPEADLCINDMQVGRFGARFTLNYRGQSKLVRSRMPFRFNVENSLAMAASLLALGWSFSKVAQSLEYVVPPDGRSKYFTLNNGVVALVDYAHNFDGLNALYNDIESAPSERVITVVGVTGDRIRDAAEIGKLCAHHSDVVVFTSDNPLGEMQEDIFRALTSQVGDTLCYEISDRQEAISLAKQLSRKGDLILVCGKGTETHQHITTNKVGRQKYIGDVAALCLEEA